MAIGMVALVVVLAMCAQGTSDSEKQTRERMNTVDDLAFSRRTNTIAAPEPSQPFVEDETYLLAELRRSTMVEARRVCLCLYVSVCV